MRDLEQSLFQEGSVEKGVRLLIFSSVRGVRLEKVFKYNSKIPQVLLHVL
jgi:hypothetical protein